jgi:WD40 repeat protein
MRFKDSNKGITAIKMVGEQLLSCLDENRAHIYKKEDNGEYKLFFTFGDSEGKVTDGDISRIDKWVAIGSEDGHVYLYRGLGMLYEFIGKIEGEDSVSSVNFNILGHLIIGDSLGNIRIYHYNGQ